MAIYTGGSIVDYLSSVGQDSSYTNRAKLAAANGISNYTGTSDQNTLLLSKLRAKATPTTTTTTTAPKVVTPTPAPVNTSTNTTNTSNTTNTGTTTTTSSKIPSTVTDTGIRQPTSFTTIGGVNVPAGSILVTSKYAVPPVMMWLDSQGKTLYYDSLFGDDVKKYAPTYYNGMNGVNQFSSVRSTNLDPSVNAAALEAGTVAKYGTSTVNQTASSSSATAPSGYVGPTAKDVANINQTTTNTSPTYTPSTNPTFPTVNLEPGSNSDDVKKLQDFLVSQKFMTPEQVQTGYGNYGTQTTAAVAAWQKANGVATGNYPGYWGPVSIAKAQTIAPSAGSTQPTATNIAQLNNNTGSATLPTSGPTTSTSSQPSAADIAQLSNNTGSATLPTSGPTSSTTTRTVAFPTVNLEPGSNNADVKKLQDWLVTQINPTTGKPYLTQAQVDTGYGNYGTQTTAAVAAWQKANGIDAGSYPGYWGPLSIAKAQTIAPAKPADTPVDNSNPAPSSNPNLITVTKGNEYNQVTGEKLPIGTVYDGKTGKITLPVYTGNETIINVPGTPTPGTTGSGTTNIGPYYGQKRDAELEKPALMAEQALAEAAKGSNLISASTIASIAANPSLVGFYINALTYGGYTLGDILNDMKRVELSSTNPNVKNMTAIISPSMNRVDYLNSPDGKKSVTETASLIPTFNLQGLINPEILKYGSNMPEDIFKMLVPILDKESQAFKDAVADVKSAFYDLANQSLQATSEQEKAIADDNYKRWKDDLDRKFGIVLSDDATKAWKQIESLGESASKLGLQGSGLQNEEINKSLSETRLTDQRGRVQHLTDEENQMASVYKSSATPAQIKALIAEDQAKGLPKSEWRATKWGLTPSDDILNDYDINNLMARYPKQTKEELMNYRNSILDENGNYRSTIYKTYYTNMNKNLMEKKATAETQVLEDAKNKEEIAYSDYDKSQPFYTGKISGTAEITSEQIAASQKAAEEMKTINNPAPTPAPVKTPAVTNTPIVTGTPVSTSGTTTGTTSSATSGGYTGGSIVDYLSSIGKSTDLTTRAAMAKNLGVAYNINAMGAESAAQNTALLAKLRSIGK